MMEPAEIQNNLFLKKKLDLKIILIFFFQISGEGQLEISINDGDVPNAVQVLGGGKCLVTYTPEQPITHEIEGKNSNISFG